MSLLSAFETKEPAGPSVSGMGAGPSAPPPLDPRLFLHTVWKLIRLKMTKIEKLPSKIPSLVPRISKSVFFLHGAIRMKFDIKRRGVTPTFKQVYLQYPTKYSAPSTRRRRRARVIYLFISPLHTGSCAFPFAGGLLLLQGYQCCGSPPHARLPHLGSPFRGPGVRRYRVLNPRDLPICRRALSQLS